MSYINDPKSAPEAGAYFPAPTYDPRVGASLGAGSGIGLSREAPDREAPAPIEIGQSMERAAELAQRLINVVERITGTPLMNNKVEPAPPQSPGLLNLHRQAARGLNRLTSQAHDAITLLEQQLGL